MSQSVPVLNGWRFDLERWDRLASMRCHVAVLRRYGDDKIPDQVDPRDWHRIENQKQMGACQGVALSTCGETAWKIATGDPNLQLSKWWCYRQSQVKDGIHSDSGSTLSAGAWVAKNLGFPLESLVPYPTSYSRSIPDSPEMKADAATRKIRKIAPMPLYDDMLRWIGLGFGGVQIGIPWPGSWMDLNANNAYLDRFPSVGNSGGHSVAIIGYLKEKAPDGSNWLVCPNSWGTGFGDRGFMYFSRTCIEGMKRTRWNEFQGLTDMTSPVPRRWEFFT